MAKQVFLEAFFPELKGNPERARPSTPKVAISRAFSDILKQVRGKRISTIKATISITDVIEEAQ
jgi:hypothetical protein